MLILLFEALFENLQMLQSFIYVWLMFFMVVHNERRTASLIVTWNPWLVDEIPMWQPKRSFMK